MSLSVVVQIPNDHYNGELTVMDEIASRVHLFKLK
jgi:hypothetical protein